MTFLKKDYIERGYRINKTKKTQISAMQHTYVCN